MAEAIARLKEVRIAPRKVRLVADMIRGKKVAEARDILTYTLKGSAPALRKLLESAVANAEYAAGQTERRIDPDEMFVGRITVDGGRTYRRFRPAPRGRAVRVRKRTSHVELVLTDKK